MDAVAVLAVELATNWASCEALSADRAAADHGGALAQRRRPVEPRVAHRLLAETSANCAKRSSKPSCRGSKWAWDRSRDLGAVGEAHAAGFDALQVG